MGNSKSCKCSPCCQDPESPENNERLMKEIPKRDNEQKDLVTVHYQDLEEDEDLQKRYQKSKTLQNVVPRFNDPRRLTMQDLNNIYNQLNEKEQIIQRKKSKIILLKQKKVEIQKNFLKIDLENHQIEQENKELREQMQFLQHSLSLRSQDNQENQILQSLEKEVKILKLQLESSASPEQFRKTIHDQQVQIEDLNEVIKEHEIKKIEIEQLKTIIEEYKQKAENYDELYECKIKDMQIIKEQNRVIQNINVGFEENNREIKRSDSNLIFAMEEQRQQQLKNNPLLQQIKNYELEKEMQTANIFKLFEDVMDKKFLDDRDDIQVNVIPRPMTQFMLDFMIQKYGLKSLACQNMAALVKGLQTLHSEKQEYAILFCRLLQVVDPKPLDKPLAIFIAWARMKFQNLLQSQAKRPSVFKTLTPEKKSHKQENFNKIVNGGEVPTFQVFQLMQQMFGENSDLQIRIMMRLCPSHITEQEFLLFIIGWKITLLGKLPHEIFTSLDKQNQGFLSFDQFQQGFKYLNLKLTQNDIQSLLSQLNPKDPQRVTEEQFIDKFTEIQTKVRNKEE